MRAKKEFNVKLGEQIKAAREGARLTQEQLAERIEVSSVTQSLKIHQLATTPPI